MLPPLAGNFGMTDGKDHLGAAFAAEMTAGKDRQQADVAQWQSEGGVTRPYWFKSGHRHHRVIKRGGERNAY